MQATKNASVVAGATLLLSGCAGLGPVPLKADACTQHPCRTTTATYTTTYFQARYMGKSIGFQFGLIGALVSEGLIDYDKKHAAERQHENEFEKRLGEFDTAEYFFGEFEKRVGDSHRIALNLNKDPNALAPIVTFMHADKDAQKSAAAIPGIENADDVGTFRLVYGLAARAGKEQFGFRKTYRAFLRLNGVVKDPKNGEVLWRDSVLAFGEKAWVGDNSDPENVDPAQLIAEFKTLTPNVIDMTMRSLNGEKLPEMPILVGSDISDAAY